MSERRPPSSFRLVAMIDQRRRSFPLLQGRNELGSRADSDVLLDAEGVSRRHATIEAHGDRLEITDLGSKNGTLLNGNPLQSSMASGSPISSNPANSNPVSGSPVRSMPLRLGDVIAICGVALKVDRLDPQDAKLGLALSTAAPSAIPPLAATTQAKVISGDASPQAVALLATLERLVSCLFMTEPWDLSGALRHLIEIVDGDAAAVIERGPRGSVILCCVGAVDQDQLAQIEPVKHVGGSGLESHHAWPGARVAWREVSLSTQTSLWLAAEGSGSWTEPLMTATISWISHIRRSELGDGSSHNPETLSAFRDLVFPKGYLPGHSPAALTVYSQMRYLTQGDVPALIIGDTGVGKELLARTLHLSSQRADGPLIAINCAAIPSELLEAELYGIARGVATGVSARIGRIQQADGGTLFLDEIGDMPLELQAKLLRVLQEKEVQPVGGRPTPVDVRVVSATHNELAEAMEAGRFRRDLYYRLAGYVLRMPGLAERKQDIPPLVEHFLRRFSAEIGKPLQGVTVKALQALCDYSWPGNVRQLEHVVRRLVYLAQPGGAVDSTLLAPEILETPDPTDAAGAVLGRPGNPGNHAADESLSGLPTLELAQLEKMAIERAMESTDGVLTDAARRLGISRDALRRRLHRHGLRQNGLRENGLRQNGLRQNGLRENPE